MWTPQEIETLAFLADAPDNQLEPRKWQFGGQRTGIAFWFEGLPDWLAHDEDYEYEYRTAIDVCAMYSQLPNTLPGGWQNVTRYGISERQCWACDGSGTGHEASGNECKPCEGSGLLYQGENQGTVYRRPCK